MAIQPYQEDSNISNPIKRIRWATQRVTGANEQKKRHSIINRLHHRKAGSSEKKRESAEAPQLDGVPEETDTSTENGDQGDSSRRIFFNIPLPDDAKDEDGHPLAKYARNKIRTAKYTPLSFIPKNLWFQFHNIANIYFLFVIVLAVRKMLHAVTACRANALCGTVLQRFRCFQPWFRLGTVDSYLICDCRQRRH